MVSNSSLFACEAQALKRDHTVDYRLLENVGQCLRGAKTAS